MNIKFTKSKKTEESGGHKRSSSGNSNFSLKSSKSTNSNKSSQSSKSLQSSKSIPSLHSRSSSATSSTSKSSAGSYLQIKFPQSSSHSNYTHLPPIPQQLQSVNHPPPPPPKTKSIPNLKKHSSSYYLSSNSSVGVTPSNNLNRSKSKHALVPPHQSRSSSTSGQSSSHKSLPAKPTTPALKHSKSLGQLLHSKPSSANMNQNKTLKKYPSRYNEDLLRNDCTCKGCKHDKSSKSSKKSHHHHHHATTSDSNSIDSVDKFANNILDFVYNKRDVNWNI